MSINYLSNINSNERDKNIIFIENGHKYIVNGESDYISVTTWIHTFVVTFDADKIIKNMMSSKNWKTSKYYGKSSEEIKKIWDNNRQNSAYAGTKLHYDIECTYNGLNVNNNSIEFKYFKNFYNDYKDLTPFRTEMLIYYEELKLSGSVDMIFINKDGIYELYDWKRSKEITKVNKFNKWMNHPCIDHLPDTNYWHYALQLNIYKAILVIKYKMLVGKLYLLVLHPDNETYIRMPVVDLQNEVKMLFDDRYNYLNKNKLNVNI